MGKVTEFRILLNTNRQVFYPGEQISGNVVLTLNETLETKGIRLVFEGRAYCKWSERRGSGKNRHTVRYTGKDTLFTFVSTLFSDGDHKKTHPAGTSNYPFMFQLPNPLPSSFETRIGHIRYAMTAKILRSWKSDHKITRPIIVNELIDTNLPQFANGPGGEKNKEVGCCWNTGPLQFDASIDRGCYCPGESIYINANVNNQTPRDLDFLKAKLVKVVEYHASSKTKRTQETIAKLEGPIIPRGQVATWRGQQFAIPPCPPTINSRIIVVSYYLELDVKVPWGFDASLYLGFVMGTIPHQVQYVQQVQQSTQPHLAPTAPQIPPPPSDIMGYPSMAPPSYAAAIAESPPSYEEYCDDHNHADDDDHDHTTFQGGSYMPVYTYARPHKL